MVWVIFRLNVKLKGYVYRRQKVDGSTTTLPLEVFTHRNFLAGFIRLNFKFIHKNVKFAFEPPFGVLWVTYALHLFVHFSLALGG